jgi:hypothetical protein
MQVDREARKTMDLMANPEELESEAEHREVSEEHAAVETGKAPSKWHRDRRLAAGRREKGRSGRMGTKGLGDKRPLYVRKKRATAIGIGGWSSGQLSPLGRGGPTYRTLKKTIKLEFVRRANGMPSGLP